MIRRPPISTLDRSSAASDVYKRQAHAYDASILLQKIIPIALKTAKPGTADFRGALKAALENAGPIPLFHGIVNYTATNHAGYTDETGVILSLIHISDPTRP